MLALRLLDWAQQTTTNFKQKMEDIMEIDKSLEESGLLIKDVSEFKYISLLGNPLTNK